MAAQSRWYSIGSWPRMAGASVVSIMVQAAGGECQVSPQPPRPSSLRTSTRSAARRSMKLCRVALRLGQPALHEIEPDRGDLQPAPMLGGRSSGVKRGGRPVAPRPVASPLLARPPASHAGSRRRAAPSGRRLGRTRLRRRFAPRRARMRVQDLDTPVVTIHLDVMEDNIRRVQAHLDRHGIGNRAAHQDAQDPRDRADAARRRRERDRLPEDRRGRGVRRSRRRARRPAHVQRPRPPEAGPPDGGRAPRRAADGGARQRGRRAGPVGGGRAARPGRPLRRRVRHGGRPERRADAGGRVRSGAGGHEAPANGLPGPDDVPQPRPRHPGLLRAGARAVQARGHPGADRLRRRHARPLRASTSSRC